MSGRSCVSTTPVWHSETHNSSGHCTLRFLEPNTHSEDDDHRDTTNWVSIFFHLSAFVAAFSSAFVPAFVSFAWAFTQSNTIRSCVFSWRAQTFAQSKSLAIDREKGCRMARKRVEHDVGTLRWVEWLQETRIFNRKVLALSHIVHQTSTGSEIWSSR